MERKIISLLLFCLFFTASYAQKEVVVIENEPQASVMDQRTIKRKVAIGRFSNETQYAKGLFYDKDNDPMGKQALDILSSKLAASGKFLLLERSDLDKLSQEIAKGDVANNQIGADYLIIGSITQYGRKSVGNQGVFSSSKAQIVEAAVTIRIVDVSTGLIIYSDEAKGLAETKSKSSFGIGGKQGYDATLSDKAISAAINKLVENVINKCTDKPWRSYLLSSDEDATIISGGASQDIRVDDVFAVVKKGKKIKNPQNGLMIELPGQMVAHVKVLMLGGDTPETEYSIVNIIDGTFDASQLNNYYVTENK
ncbi:MAG: CsgG/HfaB family protein [Bacteroidaceae bacterium]